MFFSVMLVSNHISCILREWLSPALLSPVQLRTPAGLFHLAPVSVPPSAQSPFVPPKLESSLVLPGRDSMLFPAEPIDHHLLIQAAVLEEVLVLPERLGEALRSPVSSPVSPGCPTPAPL